MAKELTAEQREAKNARERARRQALKAAPLGNAESLADALADNDEVAELPIVLEPIAEVEPEAPATPVDPARAEALAGLVGSTVFSPLTGGKVYVQRIFRGGGRFLTEDGSGVYASKCKHPEDAPKTLVYFEQVGPGNPDWADGASGFAHRFSRCNKIVSVN